MKNTSTSLDQWINQWKLDEYEIDTLMAVESSTPTKRSENELLWKENLVTLAKKSTQHSLV